MTFLDEPKNYSDTGDKEIVKPALPTRSPLMRFPLTPLPKTLLPQEEESFSDAMVSEGHVPERNDPHTFMLPATNITSFPASADVQTHHVLSYPAILNGVPFDQQQTWIIPVVRSPKPHLQSKTSDQTAKNYVSLVRNLVKSSSIYALASLAAPLISLVLAPFLTHTLTRADYGALAVLNTIIALGTGITQLGLSSAFFRAYNYDYESHKDRLGIFSTVVILLSLTSIPIPIVAYLTAPQLTILLFNNPSFSDPIRFAAVVILLQNLTVPVFAWLRAENRAGFFSLLSIVNLLITFIATLILVGVLHLGIDGSLLALAGGYACVVACSLPLILLRAGLQFRFDIAQSLLSFGVPLVFNFVSYWVLQLSDRYLLSRLGSLSQTASYAVAYSLGGVLSVVILSPFMLAWPTAMFSIAKKDDAAQVFRLIFRWFSVVLLIAAFAFSLVSIAALDLLFPSAYQSSAPVIPIISLSVMFYGVYNVFAVGVGVRRKTWLTAILMTLAALVNVALNIALIPLYGSMGAAVSTLIAYAFLALVSYIVNQCIYPVPFEIGLFIFSLALGITFYLSADFVAQNRGIYLSSSIHLVALCLYSGCLVLLGKFATLREKNAT